MQRAESSCELPKTEEVPQLIPNMKTHMLSAMLADPKEDNIETLRQLNDDYEAIKEMCFRLATFKTMKEKLQKEVNTATNLIKDVEAAMAYAHARFTHVHQMSFADYAEAAEKHKLKLQQQHEEEQKKRNEKTSANANSQQ